MDCITAMTCDAGKRSRDAMMTLEW